MLGGDQGIHLFTTPYNYYLYDAYCNNIFRLGQKTYQKLLEGSAKDVEAVCNHIRNGKKFNGFSFAYPLGIDKIRHNLSFGLNQLVLEITEKCQLRCDYCIYSGNYEHERQHSNKQMTESMAFQAIDFFVSHSEHTRDKRVVGFYGGEPLLAFKTIKKCIEHVRDLNTPMKYSITTNGLALTEEKLDFLIENEVYLQISLDGPQVIHDKYRRGLNGQGTYNDILNNLALLRKRNRNYYEKNVMFLALIVDQNTLDLVGNFFQEHLLTKSNMLIANRLGKNSIKDGRFKELLLAQKSKKEDKPYRQYYDSMVNSVPPKKMMKYQLDQLIRRIHFREIKPTETIAPNGICLPGYRKLYVRTDGTYYCCERVGDSIAIGNVSKGIQLESVLSLINNYSQMCEVLCQHCWAARLCTACFSYAQDKDGLSLSSKEERCDGIRQSIDKALQLYAKLMETNSDYFIHYMNKLGVY